MSQESRDECMLTILLSAASGVEFYITAIIKRDLQVRIRSRGFSCMLADERLTGQSSLFRDLALILGRKYKANLRSVAVLIVFVFTFYE